MTVSRVDRVAYFTWDGPGARYMRSLYLPILARLPWPVELVQVTYGEVEEVHATSEMARALGVTYTGRHFSRRPTRNATIAVGARLLLQEARRLSRNANTTVMARSILPASALIGVALPRERFVFDADGLVADERVDFAGWSPSGAPYNVARWLEKRALRRASVVATRTHAAAAILESRAPGIRLVVAPNGSDDELFRPASESDRIAHRDHHGWREDDIVIAYVGSLGPQYEPELMFEFVSALRRALSPARVPFMIVTPDVQRGIALAEGMPEVTVESLPPTKVAERLRMADIGLAFRRPTFSQRGVCPIKVGEYLLSGIPVVTNVGVGDLDRTLAPTFSWVTPSLDAESVRDLASRVVPNRKMREAARAAGVEAFSVDAASKAYESAIRMTETASQSQMATNDQRRSRIVR